LFSLRIRYGVLQALLALILFVWLPVAGFIDPVDPLVALSESCGNGLDEAEDCPYGPTRWDGDPDGGSAVGIAALPHVLAGGGPALYQLLCHDGVLTGCLRAHPATGPPQAAA
jgi:hypothetical protein